MLLSTCLIVGLTTMVNGMIPNARVVKLSLINGNLVPYRSGAGWDIYSGTGSLEIFRKRGIRHIANNVLLPLTGITTVDLSENILQDTSFLASLPKSTQKISARQSQIHTFTNTDLLNIPGLWYLDLSGNKITELATSKLWNVMNLRDLRLSHNIINAVDGQFFANLGALKILDLSWNGIRNLEKNVFRNLQQLENLSLNNNVIQHISTNIFGRIPPRLDIVNVKWNSIQPHPVNRHMQIFGLSLPLRGARSVDPKVVTIASGQVTKVIGLIW